MISDKELYKRFDKPNFESQEWDNEFLRLKNGSNVIKFINHLQTANRLFINEAFICAYIKLCTLYNKPVQEIKMLLNKLIQLNYAVAFNIRDSSTFDENGLPLPEIIIKDHNGNDIIFKKLSSFFPFIKSAYPELESNDRQGHCHLKSVLLSRYFLDFPHEVVTGYTHSFSDKSKYLHTLIEFSDNNNEPQVIDFTMNAIVNKHGYKKIMNIDEKPLSRISGENIKNELEMIYDAPKFKNLDIRKYLLFREDVLNELSPQPQS